MRSISNGIRAVPLGMRMVLAWLVHIGPTKSMKGCKNIKERWDECDSKNEQVKKPGWRIPRLIQVPLALDVRGRSLPNRRKDDDDGKAQACRWRITAAITGRRYAYHILLLLLWRKLLWISIVTELCPTNDDQNKISVESLRARGLLR